VRIDLYDLAMQPFFVLAWVTFAAGMTWRIMLFRRLTRFSLASSALQQGNAQHTTLRTASEDMAFLSRGMSGVEKIYLRLRRWARGTVFGTHPLMGVISLVFHLGLFLIPLLLPAHNILFSRRFRVSLPTLPGPLMDKLTLGLLAVGAFFLLRRILIPRVRALSTIRDYAILLLVAAPFVSAYMAYHHWLVYRAVLVTHMLIGEIVIGAIPFTKLGHMPFLVFSRFFLSGEYAWRPGNRRW
jgi:nitrate reductase gamma subunit